MVAMNDIEWLRFELAAFENLLPYSEQKESTNGGLGLTIILALLVDSDFIFSFLFYLS